MTYSLGVDLGTTFVAAAMSSGTQVEMVTLGDRSVVTPATVYLREDGTVVTGDAASRRAVTNPDRFGYELKRRLGNPTPVILGGEPRAVTTLLGALLRDVIDKVTETEGRPPERVVLTHPANWGPFRRELFEEVPAFAGFENTPLLTEPEAAAAHYAASRRLDDGETLAVYDLGGGTFDATILRKRSGRVHILGIPEGIERLGGVDFDEAIMSHVDYAAGGALRELDMRDAQTTVALARLRQDCVLAKEALSIDTDTVLPVFLPNRHFDVRITRAEFEDMVRAPIESTIGALSRTLRSAHVEPAELSAVLLVGGSSRIPLVARMVSEELGCPVVIDAHPKHAVALGAAELAAHATSIPDTDVAVEPPRPARPDAAPTDQFPVQRAPQSEVVAPAAGRAREDGTRQAKIVGTDRASGPRPAAPTAWPAPRSHGRDTPAAASETVLPNQRLATGEAQPAAESASGGSVTPVPPVGRVRQAVRAGRWSRKPALIAVGVVLALTGILVTVLVNRPPGSIPQRSGPAPPAASPPSVMETIGPEVAIPALAAPIDAGKTPAFVAVSPNGRHAYVANRDPQTVTVVDTAINRVTATIPIPAGPPQFLAFAPDGNLLYVSVFNDQRTIHLVDVIDTASNTVVGTIPQPARPFQPAVTPDGKRLYVPNHDIAAISVVDTTTNQVKGQVAVPPNPHWVAFSRDGSRAYAANHESNVVSVIDTTTDKVITTVPVGTSPHSIAVNPVRPIVANVNFDSDTVTVIDTTTDKLVATIPVGKNPRDIKWAPDGRFAYVVNDADNTISVLDAGTYRVTATIPTGLAPISVAVLPNGRQAYVSDLDSGTLTVLDLAG